MQRDVECARSVIVAVSRVEWVFASLSLLFCSSSSRPHRVSPCQLYHFIFFTSCPLTKTSFHSCPFLAGKSRPSPRLRDTPWLETPRVTRTATMKTSTCHRERTSARTDERGHTTTKHASFRPHFLCPPQTQNSHTQQRKNSERMFCRTLPKKKTPCRVAELDSQSTKCHLGDPGPPPLTPPSLALSVASSSLLPGPPLMQERDMCHSRRRGRSVNSFNQTRTRKCRRREWFAPGFCHEPTDPRDTKLRTSGTSCERHVARLQLGWT